MRITLHQLGKRFNRQWIFKNIDYTFEANFGYAITGPNGSGKSTLLQVLAGSMLHSSGQIAYWHLQQKVPPQQQYQHVAIAAPYLELIEELTLAEFLQFHHQFKPFAPAHSFSAMAQTVGLQHALHRQIRLFSSGMKQRVKLAQAFFSQAPVLLLDEPTANLDAEGIALYHSLIQQFSANRIVIVGSNDAQETQFCQHSLHLPHYQ
ncbi:MAG: ABC transporter ATP-binding protein [Bacteroidetes bacterium]|nr:MAG: ABC transporter ATP-binding protein [Bacteroidota bacterium]